MPLTFHEADTLFRQDKLNEDITAYENPTKSKEIG